MLQSHSSHNYRRFETSDNLWISICNSSECFKSQRWLVNAFTDRLMEVKVSEDNKHYQNYWPNNEFVIVESELHTQDSSIHQNDRTLVFWEDVNLTHAFVKAPLEDAIYFVMLILNQSHNFKYLIKNLSKQHRLWVFKLSHESHIFQIIIFQSARTFKLLNLMKNQPLEQSKMNHSLLISENIFYHDSIEIIKEIYFQKSLKDLEDEDFRKILDVNLAVCEDFVLVEILWKWWMIFLAWVYLFS